jgi:hypothetical protein
MRPMLIVVTVAVATLFDLRVSQATQMPWCAGSKASGQSQASERRNCRSHHCTSARLKCALFAAAVGFALVAIALAPRRCHAGLAP